MKTNLPMMRGELKPSKQGIAQSVLTYKPDPG